jgi:hypothetical protein
VTRTFVALAAVVALVGVGPSSAAGPKETPLHPYFTAVFSSTSYSPGTIATLRVITPLHNLDLQILRAGAERAWSSVGRPWGPVQHIKFRHVGVNLVRLRLGAWTSGLYFARLTTTTDKTATFAPFVLRPDTWGRNRVAVVLPTYSWQAYNFFDEQYDGHGDSWYVDPRRQHVELGRPYLTQGKPPHYRTQQRGFLRFLVHAGHQADYISDEDLEKVASGDDLAARYDLIIFSGHEEYVTQHIYDVTQRYRDLGGNLAFLSADNFFWRIDRDQRNRIWRVKLWRELARPEAALIGVQYSGNDRGGHAQPYVIQNREAAPWLFGGLDIPDGATLGTVKYGIEFDKTAPESPPGTTVLASVDPGLKGGAVIGQMTYYELNGAKVFAAGTLGFGGSDNPIAAVLFKNLWNHLVVP